MGSQQDAGLFMTLLTFIKPNHFLYSATEMPNAVATERVKAQAVLLPKQTSNQFVMPFHCKPNVGQLFFGIAKENKIH